MHAFHRIALFGALGIVSACSMFQPKPLPAPNWLAGHFKGHNVRAPSYPIDMMVDASGHVVVTNAAANKVQGQYVEGNRIVWRNGKSQSTVQAYEGGVTLTQTDGTGSVEVFQRAP